MIIRLKKFGITLISRQAGKEAYAVLQPVLENVSKNETVAVDFEGIVVFTPSWGDEFISPLRDRFGAKLILRNTENSSVQATINLLEGINHKKFIVEK